jgi:hypothetical protein
MTISQRSIDRRHSPFSEVREAARDEVLRTAATRTGFFAFATVLVTVALGSNWN